MTEHQTPYITNPTLTKSEALDLAIQALQEKIHVLRPADRMVELLGDEVDRLVPEAKKDQRRLRRLEEAIERLRGLKDA